MAPNSIPHLCGGTFFDLILESCKPHTKARKRQQGDSDGITNPAVYAGLLTVVTGEDQFMASTMEKAASNYKKCKSSTGTYVPLTEPSTISAFHSAVIKKDLGILERMSGFIDRYLNTLKCDWLVRALIETMQKDKGIDRDINIAVSKTDSCPVKKLHEVKTVELAPFLISVLDLVLQYSPDAESGRPTFETWYFQPGKKAEWKFRKDNTIGDSIPSLKIIMPSDVKHDVGKESQQPMPSISDSENAKSDYDVLKEQVLKTGSALEAVFGSIEHQMAKNILDKNNRTADTKLIDEFKNDSDYVIRYCIEKDPTRGQIELPLADWADMIIKKWSVDLQKINDPERRGLVSDIVNTLTDYTEYLADKYMHFDENTGMLIPWQNTNEEIDLLENDLRPNTRRLREKLLNLYRTLWPVPELDDSQNTKDSASSKDQPQSQNEGQKAKIIQQTVVNQYGDHPVMINHVENLNLGGDEDNGQSHKKNK